MNLLLPALVAILVGMLLPLQGLVNARLGVQVGSPVAAAFVSFLVGTLLLGAYLLATRTPIWIASSARFPAWIWAGGAFGALYVACFTVLVPRLGTASMICLAILGQVTASVLLDHFGVLQAARRADAMRILGAALVMIGVLLVAAPWRAVSTKATSETPIRDTTP